MQIDVPVMSLPSLPIDKLLFLINTPVLLVIFVLFSIVYAIVSIILIYHWTTYGMRSAGILIAETLFIFISVVLLIITFMALNYF